MFFFFNCEFHNLVKLHNHLTRWKIVIDKGWGIHPFFMSKQPLNYFFLILGFQEIQLNSLLKYFKYFVSTDHFIDFKMWCLIFAFYLIICFISSYSNRMFVLWCLCFVIKYVLNPAINIFTIVFFSVFYPFVVLVFTEFIAFYYLNIKLIKKKCSYISLCFCGNYIGRRLWRLIALADKIQISGLISKSFKEISFIQSELRVYK